MGPATRSQSGEDRLFGGRLPDGNRPVLATGDEGPPVRAGGIARLESSPQGGSEHAEAAEPGDELSRNRPCAAAWPDAHLVV